MSASDKTAFGTVASCPICKKRFVHYPEHVYVRWRNGCRVIMCSYGCLREYDRTKPKARRPGRPKGSKNKKAQKEAEHAKDENARADGECGAAGAV